MRHALLMGGLVSLAVVWRRPLPRLASHSFAAYAHAMSEVTEAGTTTQTHDVALYYASLPPTR